MNHGQDARATNGSFEIVTKDERQTPKGLNQQEETGELLIESRSLFQNTGPKSDPSQQRSGESESSGGRTLVVDDVGYTRLILRRYLESAGNSVDEASTGEEALLRYSGNKYDLVIMDYKLPDTDGLTLFQNLQNLDSQTSPSRKTPPFILCTASLDEKRAKLAVEMGFADICSKPIDRERFLKSVEKALKGWISGTPTEPPCL